MTRSQVTLSGVVKRSHLEGGLWLLDADDGQAYQLEGGDRGLYKDGQRARVTGRIAADSAGIGMAGDILRVESYEIG